MWDHLRSHPWLWIIGWSDEISSIRNQFESLRQENKALQERVQSLEQQLLKRNYDFLDALKGKLPLNQEQEIMRDFQNFLKRYTAAQDISLSFEELGRELNRLVAEGDPALPPTPTEEGAPMAQSPYDLRDRSR